ncbi:MAG: phosphotransferase [Thermomicrobiales bacterium]
MTNSALDISSDRLHTAVTRIVGGDIQDLAPLGSGAWSRAFGFTHGETALVVRIGKHVDDFQRDRLTAGFTTDCMPIPKVLAIEPVPEIGDGLFACISTRAEGTFIDALDEAEMRALLPSLLATFDAMREADLSRTTGYGGWDVTGNAPHATWRNALLDVAVDHPEGRGHGWLRKLEASRFGLDAWRILLDRLETSLKAVDAAEIEVGRHLIHSDMLNFNVFCDPDEHRISALFDWGCAMTGDPLYDLAWFAYWQPWYPAWESIDFVSAVRDHLTRTGVVPAFAERLRACTLHIALGDLAYSASIDRWDDLDHKVARALHV